MRESGKPPITLPSLRATVLAIAVGLGAMPLMGCSLGLDPSRINADASTMAGGDGGSPPTNADGGDGGYVAADGGYVPGDGGACPPCVLDESKLDECCLQ